MRYVSVVLLIVLMGQVRALDVVDEEGKWLMGEKKRLYRAQEVCSCQKFGKRDYASNFKLETSSILRLAA
jgi:hypothetical protein